MKRLLTALLIIACVLFAGCERIKSGEVYNKEFVPAHTESYSYTQIIYVNDQCIRIPQTRTEFVPDKYRIYIRKENDKGKFETAMYEVGRERYEQIKIGDEITFE